MTLVTPAGSNPYVNYANSNAATRTTAPVTQSVVASALIPVSSSYTIVVPAGMMAPLVSTADLGASLENLLANLSESVSAAVVSELGRLTE
jgi:hypothetical protein